MSLITPESVALDADLGPDKAAVVRGLAGLVAAAGRATDADVLAADALAREATAATGLPGGIAVPHCRSAAVAQASLAFARLSPPVAFGAPDGPADLAFLVATPEHGDADHLTLLTALARALAGPRLVPALRAARTPAEAAALVQEAVAPPRGAGPAPGSTSAPIGSVPS
jgi:fructose PTS system EIIBC or EIIC component